MFYIPVLCVAGVLLDKPWPQDYFAIHNLAARGELI